MASENFCLIRYIWCPDDIMFYRPCRSISEGYLNKLNFFYAIFCVHSIRKANKRIVLGQKYISMKQESKQSLMVSELFIAYETQIYIILQMLQRPNKSKLYIPTWATLLR